MMRDADMSAEIAEAVSNAAAANAPLAIHGAGTKRFHTGEIAGAPLDVTGHRGIVSYEPTELVVTARAGTPLAEIEAALAEKNQMLGFEPPHFGDGATLGGTVACGLSGPRRPYAGAARDFVLGVRLTNGRGEVLRFGGQVMKNVAGYDVSRLIVGSFGTLGIILEVSLKVLPRPARESTLAFELPAAEAIEKMNAWAGRPLPLSGAFHVAGRLYTRLSGAESAVRAAAGRLGGTPVDDAERLWLELREHEATFFRGDTPLWRLSVPPAAPLSDLPGEWLLDWGGAQRWFRGDASVETICTAAESCGGHATLFRANGRRESPDSLPPGLRHLHRALKTAFDHAHILNPGLSP